jgi:hypothetical protein
MRMSAAFPSAYLKASDLNGKKVRIKMDRVEMEDIGGDHKPVLYFVGTDKKMVVNKTNANEIIDAYGDDTDDWHGKTIELYEARVDFQGKKVMAIRVNAMLKEQGVAAQAPLPAAPKMSALGAQQSALADEREARLNGTLPKADPFDAGDEIPF